MPRFSNKPMARGMWLALVTSTKGLPLISGLLKSALPRVSHERVSTSMRSLGNPISVAPSAITTALGVVFLWPLPALNSICVLVSWRASRTPSSMRARLAPDKRVNGGSFLSGLLPPPSTTIR